MGFQDHGISQSSADTLIDLSGNAETIQVFLIFSMVKDLLDQAYYFRC